MGDVLAESDFQMFQFEEDQIETNDSNNLEHRESIVARNAIVTEEPKIDLALLDLEPTIDLALLDLIPKDLTTEPKIDLSENKNELDPETRQKVLEQVEFYFSDANVTKDKELAKQIRRNDMGYVSIKWITSFRKIQALTQEWKAVSKVLLSSTELKVSQDRKMVRRKHPIPKKNDAFADKTVMASKLDLKEKSVDCVKSYFSMFGKVTLVRFLQPGKAFPDDINALRLRNYSSPPKVEMIAVEFDTAEAAEDAVKKLADNNNWRSTSKIELLRPRAKTPVAGAKSRKCSENGMAQTMTNGSCLSGSYKSNGNYAKSLPQQMYNKQYDLSPNNSPGTYRKTPSGAEYNKSGKSPQSSYTSRGSFSARSYNSIGDNLQQARSYNSNSVGDNLSASPSANSYLGQRLAMERNGTGSPAAVHMKLIREPHRPDGTKGFARSK